VKRALTYRYFSLKNIAKFFQGSDSTNFLKIAFSRATCKINDRQRSKLIKTPDKPLFFQAASSILVPLPGYFVVFVKIRV